jgi:hypothetical protein
VSDRPDPDSWIAPAHDPFEGPDAEPEADTRERVLEGGEDAGDGEAADVRKELGLDEPEGEGGAAGRPTRREARSPRRPGL